MDNGGAAGASTSDADITQWCISRISRIASAIFDPPPSASSIESLITNATTSATHFASGHRLSTIFIFLSSDGLLRVEESLSQHMQPNAAVTVLTRASTTALNPAVAWHEQIIVVTLPCASAVDSLHLLLNRATRPLLDAAAGAPPSSKHMPKAKMRDTHLKRMFVVNFAVHKEAGNINIRGGRLFQRESFICNLSFRVALHTEARF
jgi:hypothetical protein